MKDRFSVDAFLSSDSIVHVRRHTVTNIRTWGGSKDPVWGWQPLAHVYLEPLVVWSRCIAVEALLRLGATSVCIFPREAITRKWPIDTYRSRYIWI